MNPGLIQKKFEEMGARLRIREDVYLWRGLDFSLDVRKDKGGEFFDLALAVPADLKVLALKPRGRHLILDIESETGVAETFLCGHDERRWFIAGVPRGTPSVEAAKKALKPVQVRQKEAREQVKAKDANRRKNKAFKRQGEWFFVPVDSIPANYPILYNEPIRRGRSKPHIVEELCRIGGQSVYVNHTYPNGLTEAEYQNLLETYPKLKKRNWTHMRRDAAVYAKGKVWHPDHKTLVLKTWHRVFPNQETGSRRLAFLD